MIHQGTITASDIEKQVISEKVFSGNMSQIIHLYLKKDAKLYEHVAKTKAYLMVISGEIDFISDGKRFHLKQGDFITFGATVMHSLKAYEDSHLMLVK